jgi:hypothetical protein
MGLRPTIEMKNRLLRFIDSKRVAHVFRVSALRLELGPAPLLSSGQVCDKGVDLHFDVD